MTTIRKKTVKRKTKRRSKQNALKKRKNTILKSLAVVCLVTVSLLMFTGYSAYKTLTLPFVNAYSLNSYDVSSQEIVPIVVVGHSENSSQKLSPDFVKVIFVDRVGNKVVSYNFTDSTVISAPGKYGRETLKNIFALGSVISSGNIDESATFTASSLQKYFAFPIKKYVIVNNHTDFGLVEFLETGNSAVVLNKSLFDNLHNNLNTNLSFREFYTLFNDISKLPSDRFFSTTITQENMRDTSTLDENLRDMMFDTKPTNETKAITILNGTNVSGVATLASRVVENVGGRVLTIGNAVGDYDESVLIVDDINSATVNKLIQYFEGIKVVNKSDAQNYNENEIYRSDITLIIGIDIVDSL